MREKRVDRGGAKRELRLVRQERLSKNLQQNLVLRGLQKKKGEGNDNSGLRLCLREQAPSGMRLWEEGDRENNEDKERE